MLAVQPMSTAKEFAIRLLRLNELRVQHYVHSISDDDPSPATQDRCHHSMMRYRDETLFDGIARQMRQLSRHGVALSSTSQCFIMGRFREI